MPATKAPAKKAASKKKASKKKNADSDEDEYVPEKEEPDEALDVKLEEEAGDVEPAEDDEGEDEDEEELVPKRKGGKQASTELKFQTDVLADASQLFSDFWRCKKQTQNTSNSKHAPWPNAVLVLVPLILIIQYSFY